MGSNIVAQSPSPNSPEPDGYKQLPSEGQVYTGYQALHKYTYITAGDPVVKWVRYEKLQLYGAISSETAQIWTVLKNNSFFLPITR